MQNIAATMMNHWMQAFALLFIAINYVQCCKTRDIIYEPDPEALTPPDEHGNHDPPRMLGWEQMILMFKGPYVRIL